MKLTFGDLEGKHRAEEAGKAQALYERRVADVMIVLKQFEVVNGRETVQDGPLSAYPVGVRHHGAAVIHDAAKRLRELRQ